LANHHGCLAGQKQSYTVPQMARPFLDQRLVIKAANYTNGATRWLKEALESEGIAVEIQWLSFQNKLLDITEKQTADLFIHGEVFEMNQDFSFFNFLSNGYSPMTAIMKSQPQFNRYLKLYAERPFKEWTKVNLEVERTLLEDSIMVPLYYEKRQIPFSVDLMNISISHFGYVDFSKLWVRPV